MRHMIFGESHGPAIGVVLEGVPAGLELDLEAVQRELDRRKPGQDPTATARRESDTVQVLSGVFEGKTTGAPLAMLIRNSDQHSQDYEAIRYTPRPGHGDYAGFIKSQGCQDYRGGGHFSGRLTAPLVAAGAVAKQALALRGVRVGAHISSIYGITDASLEDAGALEAVAAKPFPVLDDAKGEEMRQAILEAKNEQDSVGGAIECAVFGLPAGLGAPDFGRNVEGIFAQYLFAVPAVKGVDFGAGVAFSLMRGSEANDPFEVKDGRVVTKTNHAGGVNGGITNGMPVTFEVTIRPTPSIALLQESVDLRTGEETEIEIKGRHDPCIVPRAVPVIEAAALNPQHLARRQCCRLWGCGGGAGGVRGAGDLGPPPRASGSEPPRKRRPSVLPGAKPCRRRDSLPPRRIKCGAPERGQCALGCGGSIGGVRGAGNLGPPARWRRGGTAECAAGFKCRGGCPHPPERKRPAAASRRQRREGT